MASSMQRVSLVHNASRSGIQHYLNALLKYNITPTVPGPFQVLKEIEKLEPASKPAAVIDKVQQTLGIHNRKTVTHRTLVKTDQDGQTGRITAQDADQGSEYLAPVTIGTPGKTFNLDFDTGSADLWVFGSKLSAEQKGTHVIFDPSASSTYTHMDGSTWSISYGDQSSASGTVGTDNIVMGNLTVHNQAIESADKISSEFEKQTSDGLLGLAFSTINTVQPTAVASPVENMIAQHDVTSQVFTAWFEPPTGTSWYSFGYIDQAALGGASPSYTPQFPSTVATVNGKSISLGQNNTCIADTGTTLTLLPDHACQEIYSVIPGAKLEPSVQGWTFPASAALPAISIAVGSTLFQMSPSDLAFQQLPNGTMYGGIQSNGNLPLGILGDTFLRAIYAIFDQGNQRFGAVQRPIAAGQGTSSGIPVSNVSSNTTGGPQEHHSTSSDGADHSLHERHGHEKLAEHPSATQPGKHGKHWYDGLLHHDPKDDYSRRSSG